MVFFIFLGFGVGSTSQNKLCFETSHPLCSLLFGKFQLPAYWAAWSCPGSLMLLFLFILNYYFFFHFCLLFGIVSMAMSLISVIFSSAISKMLLIPSSINCIWDIVVFISRILVWVYFNISQSLLNIFNLSSSYLNIWTIVKCVLMFLLANSQLCVSFSSVSIDWFWFFFSLWAIFSCFIACLVFFF